MTEILNKLPKELRDLIGEYNVNHRPLMKKVLQELTKPDNKCSFCKIELNDNEDIQYGIYIYTWDKDKLLYCSSECCEAGDWGKPKARARWLERLNNL
jgi:hypothetical protein